MAVALAIGAAGIPGSGVMTITVLQAVNLPLHDWDLFWLFIGSCKQTPVLLNSKLFDLLLADK